MNGHIHADLIGQYAADAKDTDKPHERWEECVSGKWEPCDRAPQWFPHRQYRRKEGLPPLTGEVVCTKRPLYAVLQPSGLIHKMRGTYEAAMRCKQQWDARYGSAHGIATIAAFTRISND